MKISFGRLLLFLMVIGPMGAYGWGWQWDSPQCNATPWPCSGTVFQLVEDKLVKMEVGENPVTMTTLLDLKELISKDKPIVVNAAGYNEEDNFIYAQVFVPQQTSHRVYRIGSNENPEDALCDLGPVQAVANAVCFPEIDGAFIVGDVIADNKMIIGYGTWGPQSLEYFFRLDLTNGWVERSSSFEDGRIGWASDAAWDANSGLLLSRAANGDIMEFDISNWPFVSKEHVSAATCADGVHNGDETGIDCGGSCIFNCPTCEPWCGNNEKVPWKKKCTWAACSGCTACGACDDDTQNGDETGVDCGGSCDDECASGGKSEWGSFWSFEGKLYALNNGNGKLFKFEPRTHVGGERYYRMIEVAQSESNQIKNDGMGCPLAESAFPAPYDSCGIEGDTAEIAQDGDLVYKCHGRASELGDTACKFSHVDDRRAWIRIPRPENLTSMASYNSDSFTTSDGEWTVADGAISVTLNDGTSRSWPHCCTCH